jgi:hypothetical protein
MAKLDIAKAARAVGKSRGTLYKYIKEGKLTCDATEKGHKVIDSAELLRVFGELETDGSKKQVDTIVRKNAPSDRSEIEQLLRDRIRDLEKQVEGSRERESELLTVIKQQQALLMPPKEESAKETNKKGFFGRLFGGKKQD